MKIQLLNKILDETKPVAVSFLFPPIVLPIDDQGKLVPESNAVGKHFTTLVYSRDTKQFFVFEFDQKILDGVSAYKTRYENLAKIEVILSRFSSGAIRMTIGANNISEIDQLLAEADKVKEDYNKLYQSYKDKPCYTVYEMTRG